MPVGHSPFPPQPHPQLFPVVLFLFNCDRTMSEQMAPETLEQAQALEQYQRMKMATGQLYSKINELDSERNEYS